MNCEQSNEWMMQYFDGTLDDIKTAQMKQHFKVCSPCSRDFKQLSQLMGVLEADDAVCPPDGFTVQVMKRIEKYEALRMYRRSKLRMYLYNGIAVAATILLIVFAAIYSDTFLWLAQLFEIFSGNTFRIIADIAGILFDAAKALFMNYSYIVISLLAILLAVQKTFFLLVERNGGEGV